MAAGVGVPHPRTNAKDSMYNNTKVNYRQKSQYLSLDAILHLVANKTGCNPKLSGKSYVGSCPSHNDKNASLSIREAEDGTILLKCFADCSFKEICSSLCIKAGQLFPQKNRG
jgi:hypothetical protein